MDFVVYGNGRYVAFGEYSDYGVILTSEDGITWVLRSDGGATSGSGISFSVGLVYTGGKFFALGGFGQSGVSTNGVDWSVVSGYWGLNSSAGIAYGASKYVGVGWDQFGSDQNIFTSTDGLNWTPRHSGSGSYLVDVAYGAGLFVALGAGSESGHSYTSPTGTTWTKRNIPTGGTHISFYNGIFIITHASGTNLISSDGITWAPIPTSINNKLEKVFYAQGLYMARAGSFLATSTDGTNWIQYPQPLPGTGLATDGARLVTVGKFPDYSNIYYDGFIYYSDPLVGLRIAKSWPPQVVLSGIAGRFYRIESTDTLSNTGPITWDSRLTVQLTNSTFFWTDGTAANSSHRFYRAVLLP